MTRGRRRLALGCGGLLAAVLVGLGALLAWPEAPPRATGAWLARAGVEPLYVEANGLRLRYVRRGQGPTVVLLHGFSSSIYTWADVIPPLAARFDVVAVDLPGFGGSQVPARSDAAGAARTFTAFLDALGIGKAHLVGNSLGGALAAVTAAEEPQRVERLVLIDAAGYNMARQDRPALLRMIGSAPPRLVEAVPLRPMMRMGLRQVFHDDTRVSSERVEEYLAPMARPGARAASRALLASAEGLGLPGALRRVRAPTLVIWGRQDRWIPVEHADRFLRDIPGASKAVIEGCGHVPQEEKPHELARLLLGFLG